MFPRQMIAPAQFPVGLMNLVTVPDSAIYGQIVDDPTLVFPSSSDDKEFSTVCPPGAPPTP